jgi:hypothetical protein
MFEPALPIMFEPALPIMFEPALPIMFEPVKHEMLESGRCIQKPLCVQFHETQEVSVTKKVRII